MTQRSFLLVSGSLFALIAIVHALRLVFGWTATVGGWTVPGWISAVGLLIAGYLAYQGFLLTSKKP